MFCSATCLHRSLWKLLPQIFLFQFIRTLSSYQAMVLAVLHQIHYVSLLVFPGLWFIFVMFGFFFIPIWAHNKTAASTSIFPTMCSSENDLATHYKEITTVFLYEWYKITTHHVEVTEIK